MWAAIERKPCQFVAQVSQHPPDALEAKQPASKIDALTCDQKFHWLNTRLLKWLLLVLYWLRNSSSHMAAMWST